MSQSADLGREFGIGANPGPFNGLHLFFETPQRLIYRLDDVPNLIPAVVQKQLAVRVKSIGG